MTEDCANRYVYGFRLIWAFLFIGIGYAFGLDAEQVGGAALARREHLLFGVIISGTGWYAARKLGRRQVGF